MSLSSLLPDTCSIQRKTVTEGMIDTESWATLATGVRCRVMKRSSVKTSPQTAQWATVISTRFVLSKNQTIAIRDRIIHEGRTYDVIELVEPFDQRAKHHRIAVCEAVAGNV